MHNFTASPPNGFGHFSPQTSAVNFCEIDYAVTPYLAEFINSLSNLAYTYLSISTLPPSSSVFNILSWPSTNISLFLVGVGSFAFHATLKHTAQMADELAMYAIISTLNYRIYTYKLLSSPSAKLGLGLILSIATALVGYSNYTSDTGADTILHLVLFITLLTTFWPRVLHLINDIPPSVTSSKISSAGTGQSEVYQRATQKRQRRDFRLGCLSFGMGFVFWLIDGLCCEHLRDIRTRIGLPLAWILEFHGTWHVLTAIGAGMFVSLVTELTTEEWNGGGSGRGRAVRESMRRKNK